MSPTHHLSSAFKPNPSSNRYCHQTAITAISNMSKLPDQNHTYPGMGRNAGYLRSHIATGNCTATDCIVEVPVTDYVRKWNLSLNQYQVHCRYLLIDTQTGYRCNYKKMSFITAVN